MSRGTSIVAAAEQYVGIPYRFGGGSPQGWDCSGFVNWVLGHDLGMVLPGGVSGFNGASHGPVVLQYAAWRDARTVSGPPQAGDLCIWPGAGPLGHIGIAANSTHMISALDPHYGTAVTPIAGYGPPVPLVYRRIAGVADTGGTGTPGAPGAALPAGCLMSALMLPALPVLALTASRRRRRGNTASRAG